MPDMSSAHARTSVLITGGAQGVGWAVAEQMLSEGCQNFALVGRDIEKGKVAAERLIAKGAHATFIQSDLQRHEDVSQIIAQASTALGPVNALVNAAGNPARGTLIEETLDNYEAIFAVNVRGPFFLKQDFVRHRLAQGGGGTIVNVLSQCVHAGQSFLAAYSASKGALATLTKNVANAYRGSRIRCNAVLPGWMDTPGENATQRRFHKAGDDWLEKAEASQPMGQLCKPDQLAVLISYLLSPQSGVMTGALIDYDQNIPGAYPE